MQISRGGHHPGSQAVHPQDAAEDVDEDGLYILVGEQDLERVLDLFLAGAAAHIQEVGRTTACVLNDVHGGHGQAGAVYHAGDRAIQLDVVERVLAGFNLQGILFGGVAQRFYVRMPEQRVVVEVDLGVQREQLVVQGGDERIDFQQRSIGL